MNAHDTDPETEKPLDPAMERVRRKLVRLLAVSIGTLLIGLMAVLGAVVYKTGDNGDVPAEAYRATLTLPSGFSIDSTSYSDGRILVFGEDGEGLARILLFDAASGSLVADHRVR